MLADSGMRSSLPLGTPVEQRYPLTVFGWTTSHASIGIHAILAYCRECCHQSMRGRQVAHRIRGRCVPGQRESLAAAAAEIEIAPRATRARLFHPSCAAERFEARR